MLIEKIELIEYGIEEYKKEEVKKELEKLKKDWFEKQDKLSFFIEHDELEKVSESLILMEENFKNEEYTMALQESQEFLYWLNHCKEKDELKLKNIF